MHEKYKNLETITVNIYLLYVGVIPLNCITTEELVRIQSVNSENDLKGHSIILRSNEVTLFGRKI